MNIVDTVTTLFMHYPVYRGIVELFSYLVKFLEKGLMDLFIYMFRNILCP